MVYNLRNRNERISNKLFDNPDFDLLRIIMLFFSLLFSQFNYLTSETGAVFSHLNNQKSFSHQRQIRRSWKQARLHHHPKKNYFKTILNFSYKFIVFWSVYLLHLDARCRESTFHFEMCVLNAKAFVSVDEISIVQFLILTRSHFFLSSFSVKITLDPQSTCIRTHIELPGLTGIVMHIYWLTEYWI